MILLCLAWALQKNITNLNKQKMKLTDYIAQHIIDVHEGENWTEVTIKDVLTDVNYKEAITVTNASPNTIASMLYHVSFYNDVIKQRLAGINPSINSANGFDMPPITNEEQWQQLKQRNLESARQVADAAKNFPEEKLFDVTVTGHSTHYRNLHGIAEHAHYHLGQMGLLKNLIRKNNEKSITRNSL